MPETIDDEHGDFGTVSEQDDVVEAGSTDVEMDIQDDEGIPEQQEVDPAVQEALDNAVEEGSATQYDSHKEAINAATGNDGEDEDYDPDADPKPEDFMMDSEEVENTDSSEDTDSEEDITENLPDATSDEVGMEDGEMDFSALKSTEEVTETVTRNGNEFEFVFKEPEESDDEIINMVRDKQQGSDDIDESEIEADLRKEAVMKTLVSPSPEVVDSQWDEFAGSVKLQLGGRALQVLGLMDFIRASGAGPQLQQEG